MQRTCTCNMSSLTSDITDNCGTVAHSNMLTAGPSCSLLSAAHPYRSSVARIHTVLAIAWGWGYASSCCRSELGHCLAPVNVFYVGQPTVRGGGGHTPYNFFSMNCVSDIKLRSLVLLVLVPPPASRCYCAVLLHHTSRPEDTFTRPRRYVLTP